MKRKTNLQLDVAGHKEGIVRFMANVTCLFLVPQEKPHIAATGTCSVLAQLSLVPVLCLQTSVLAPHLPQAFIQRNYSSWEKDVVDGRALRQSRVWCPGFPQNQGLFPLLHSCLGSLQAPWS